MPISAKLSVEGFKLDASKYRKTLDDALYNAMLKVAVVWVRTALHSVDGTFPVITGMARASFSNLVEYLRNPPRGDGKRIAFNQLEGVQFDRVTSSKNITAGKQLSKKSNFIVTLKNQYGPFKYTFEWWTSVEHFLVNEVDPDAKQRFHLIHDTPWRVMEQAFAAAEAYTPVALRQVPHIYDYLDKYNWEVT